MPRHRLPLYALPAALILALPAPSGALAPAPREEIVVDPRLAPLLAMGGSGSAPMVVVEERTLRVPHEAGDLDGDGTEDLLVLESVSLLRARSGATGASLWTRRADVFGTYTAVGATSDLTGDAAADVLVLTRVRAGHSDGGSHLWRLTLLSGPAGADAWSREYPGLGGSGIFVGAYAHALVVPYLLGDRIVVNAIDTHFAFAGASACVGIPWSPWWDCYGGAGAAAMGSRTRAEVLTGDGALVALRASAPTSAGGLLLPAGRVHGSGRLDLVWQEAEGGTVAAAACAGVWAVSCTVVSDPRRLIVERLDGASLAPLWRRDLGDVHGLLAPLGADATGDGTDDLLLRTWSYPRSWSEPVALLDGATGATAWTRMARQEPVATMGSVDGGPGVDLLFGISLRVDGARGATLLDATSRAVVRAWPCRVWTWEVTADVDLDGVLDVARHLVCEKPRSEPREIGASCRDLAEPELLGVLVVDSGATAARLLERDYGPGRCWPFGSAAGDLDGDGAEDFLLKFDADGQDVVEAVASDDRTLWTRVEGQRWPQPTRGPDRSGDGFADPLASVWDLGRQRLELWSGRDGTTRWTTG